MVVITMITGIIDNYGSVMMGNYCSMVQGSVDIMCPLIQLSHSSNSSTQHPISMSIPSGSS